MGGRPQVMPTRFPCWCKAVYSWGGEVRITAVTTRCECCWLTHFDRASGTWASSKATSSSASMPETGPGGRADCVATGAWLASFPPTLFRCSTSPFSPLPSAAMPRRYPCRTRPPPALKRPRACSGSRFRPTRRRTILVPPFLRPWTAHRTKRSPRTSGRHTRA